MGVIFNLLCTIGGNKKLKSGISENEKRHQNEKNKLLLHFYSQIFKVCSKKSKFFALPLILRSILAKIFMPT